MSNSFDAQDQRSYPQFSPLTYYDIDLRMSAETATIRSAISIMHGLLTPMNIYARALSVVFFVNVNPVINTAATFTHLRIEYRGCPPL
jgi:hypothetical protein